jgi:ribokinase
MNPIYSSAPIVVVGSANQDYIVRVPQPPAPGETVLARSLVQQPGGKGANQAVAAARLRGNVSFVASVGDDADGAALLRELRAEGVDASNVEIIAHARTGLAFVAVYDSGENSITVVPGSNFALTPDRVRLAVTKLTTGVDGAILVVQAELVPGIIEASLLAAQATGARPILNLAPFQIISPKILQVCDPLVVNETEVSAMVGWDVTTPQLAEKAIGQLRGTVRSAVVTLGAQGAVWADDESSGHCPAPHLDRVVDTTGAGDAFVGALAVMLAKGASLVEAVKVGVLAGSFAVGSTGAQSSYPTQADLGLNFEVAS